MLTFDARATKHKDPGFLPLFPKVHLNDAFRYMESKETDDVQDDDDRNRNQQQLRLIQELQG